MQTTFILAKNFNVTPFEIMAQDLEEVIMVLDYLIESGKENNNDNIITVSEKEKDRDFWNVL